MSWEEALAAIQGRLSAEDAKTFARLHKNFVSYVSESTLTRFYDFVFARGVQNELSGYRFRRLEKILAGLAAVTLPRGARILEIGAGPGAVAAAARTLFAPAALVVADISSGARDALAARGFTVLPHPAPAAPPQGPFDLVICADAIGELNSDDDGFLKQPGTPPEEIEQALEERYGFAQKLGAWKPYLAPAGRLLLWEPIARREAWDALARYLGETWKTRLHADVSGGEHLELSLP